MFKMKYKLQITDRGVEINREVINEKIFQEELFDYRVEDKKTFIDLLIDWISESNSNKDKYLMKEDLKMIMEKEDNTFFSSIHTNKYIFPDDEEFNQICEELIKLNREFKK